MVRRPSDLFGQLMVDLLSSFRCTVEWKDGDVFFLRTEHAHPALRWVIRDPKESISTMVAARWINGGPKVFRPTAEQQEAFEHVDVNLPPSEYAQPFPSLCVDFAEPIGPMRAVILLHEHPLLALLGVTGDHTEDVVTAVNLNLRKDMEETLSKFDESVESGLKEHATVAYRVAVNSALFLVDRGFRRRWALPVERDSDVRLAREETERGERARRRLPLHCEVLECEVTVRDVEHGAVSSGHHASPRAHWRRGHWRMQRCGAGLAFSKRLFIKPVLVGVGRPPETTVYKG